MIRNVPLLLLLLILCTVVKSTKQATLHEITPPPTQHDFGSKQVDVGDSSSSHLSLEEFLEKKPPRMDSVEGELYMIDFSNRSEVPEMNFEDEDTKAVVNRVLALEKRTIGRNRRHKLSTLVDRYLREFTLKPKLLAELRGFRFRRQKESGNVTAKEKKFKSDAIGYLAKKKEYQDKSYVNRRAKNDSKPMPLDPYLRDNDGNQKLSALEIAKDALSFMDLYKRQIEFTWALRHYLKARRYSSVDIKSASGWAALQIRAKKRVQRRVAKNARKFRSDASTSETPNTRTPIEENNRPYSRHGSASMYFHRQFDLRHQLQASIDERMSESHQEGDPEPQNKECVRYVDKVLENSDWWHPKHF